jgi:iron-sulfur cluster repair protein YtfE (RIC family)
MQNLTQLDPTLTINEIVARYPATIPVFNRFGMDTCCGGGVSVYDAARRDGIDVEAVLVALREVVDRS